jgi:hypothetical protein
MSFTWHAPPSARIRFLQIRKLLNDARVFPAQVLKFNELETGSGLP